jgi:hypothetical protein
MPYVCVEFQLTDCLVREMIEFKEGLTIQDVMPFIELKFRNSLKKGEKRSRDIWQMGYDSNLSVIITVNGKLLNGDRC